MYWAGTSLSVLSHEYISKHTQLHPTSQQMVWCGLTPSFLNFLNYFLGGKGSPLRSETLLPVKGDGDNSTSPSPVSPRKKMQINKLGGLAILNRQMLSCKYTVNLQSIAPVRPPPLVHNKKRLRLGTPSKQQPCLASSHVSARMNIESRQIVNHPYISIPACARLVSCPDPTPKEGRV